MIKDLSSRMTSRCERSFLSVAVGSRLFSHGSRAVRRMPSRKDRGSIDAMARRAHAAIALCSQYEYDCSRNENARHPLARLLSCKPEVGSSYRGFLRGKVEEQQNAWSVESSGPQPDLSSFTTSELLLVVGECVIVTFQVEGRSVRNTDVHRAELRRSGGM
jgi:hypothetical protein